MVIPASSLPNQEAKAFVHPLDTGTSHGSAMNYPVPDQVAKGSQFTASPLFSEGFLDSVSVDVDLSFEDMASASLPEARISSPASQAQFCSPFNTKGRRSKGKAKDVYVAISPPVNKGRNQATQAKGRKAQNSL
ncbi:hypothetical protein Acr_08g0004710 [Actinidia rufa]|uniref:Uncharacterized protein n=1 Tax=Actinidia rufa TaxID=165716 RepID=A0A7J0F053_9ERIC|nr:hypothetical protein Acr_08g0004710 [Actinidia rufa]